MRIRVVSILDHRYSEKIAQVSVTIFTILTHHKERRRGSSLVVYLITNQARPLLSAELGRSWQRFLVMVTMGEESQKV